MKKNSAYKENEASRERIAIGKQQPISANQTKRAMLQGFFASQTPQHQYGANQAQKTTRQRTASLARRANKSSSGRNSTADVTRKKKSNNSVVQLKLGSRKNSSEMKNALVQLQTASATVSHKSSENHLNLSTPSIIARPDYVAQPSTTIAQAQQFQIYKTVNDLSAERPMKHPSINLQRGIESSGSKI